MMRAVLAVLLAWLFPRRRSRDAALKKCGSMADTWEVKRGTVMDIDGTLRQQFATSTTQSRQFWEERARTSTSIPAPIAGCRLVLPPLPPAQTPARAGDRLKLVSALVDEKQTRKKTG